MFRLEDRQFHMILLLILGASAVLFCFFGVRHIPAVEEQGRAEGMEDFSDGWVCTYKTEDEQKLQEYRSTEENSSGGTDNIIQEVLTLPGKLPVAEGETLSLLHKVPELELDTIYMMLKTDCQTVKVSVGQNILYESDKRAQKLPSYHVIPLSPEYQEQIIVIELTGQSGNYMEVESICTGTRNQLWMELLMENGVAVVTGLMLICISLCMLLVYAFIKNTWKQKKCLLYSSLEGLFLGLLFIVGGKIFPVLTGWNYGAYLLRACLVIVLAVLHLMNIRCFVSRRRVLAFLDTGILVFGVFYISAIVLQAFSLVQFDTVYSIGRGLLGISILIYTALLGITVYYYGQKEGKPVFYANAVLLFGILVQIIMWCSGREIKFNNIYIPIGFVIYMVMLWIFTLKKALPVTSGKQQVSYSEEEMRARFVEQMNPDFLFASFHTLQKLIKNGSGESVKMIYYIFVYIKCTLKAIGKAGEAVPFEEELEHIIAYLQLQRMSNAGVNFTVECKVKDFHIPRYSIEPMVENAVEHGILSQGGTGNVVVRTYLRAEGYAVQVVDDGAGFDSRILKRKSPIALLNLLSVLEETCQAQTEVISKEGKGTVITVVLPALENEQLDEPEELE